MRSSLKIISVRGINISVHWTFIFFIAWIMFINARAGVYIDQLGWIALFIIAIFVCVTLHELGHALVARKFGIQAKDIILLPIGGIASIEKFPDNPKQELAISAAGPLVNIIIALSLLPFLQPYTPLWEVTDHIRITHQHDFIYNLHVANLALAAFNLIPAFPMDGGRIFRALLGFRINYVRATSIAAVTGKVIASIFIVLGLVIFDPIILLIGIFIIVSASTEEYYLRLKSLVKGMKIKEIVMHDFDSLQAGMPVRDAASFFMNNHAIHFVVMDGTTPVGTISRVQVVKAVAEKQYDQPIRALVKEPVTCFNGEEEIVTVLEKLAGKADKVFPVMVQGQFSGVTSFTHLIEYLLIYRSDSEEYDRIRSLAGLVG